MVIELMSIADGQLYYELVVPHDFPAGSMIRFGQHGETLFTRVTEAPILAGTAIRFLAAGDPFISITSPKAP